MLLKFQIIIISYIYFRFHEWLIHFKIEKRGYLSHYYLDKGFKGTFVHLTSDIIKQSVTWNYVDSTFINFLPVLTILRIKLVGKVEKRVGADQFLDKIADIPKHESFNKVS